MAENNFFQKTRLPVVVIKSFFQLLPLDRYLILQYGRGQNDFRKKTCSNTRKRFKQSFITFARNLMLPLQEPERLRTAFVLNSSHYAELDHV